MYPFDLEEGVENMADDAASAVAAAAETASNESGKKLPMTHQDSLEDKVCYRVTRRVFSKSVTSILHIWFQKILAGSKFVNNQLCK